MIESFQALPSGQAMSLGILLFIACSVLLSFLVCRLAPARWRETFRLVHPPLCASLMVVFAIFAVIVANTEWRDREDAGRTTRAEAYAVETLVQHMPQSEVGRARLAAYLAAVTELEWPQMAGTRGEHPEAAATLRALHAWVLIPDVPYAHEEQRRLVQDAVRDLGKAREHRLTLTQALIPTVIWMALLSSGLAVLVAVIIAHAHAPRAAALMSVLYGAVLGALLCALLLLDHPYAGSVGVTPELLQAIRAKL